jgi:hypothetical protein
LQAVCALNNSLQKLDENSPTFLEFTHLTVHNTGPNLQNVAALKETTMQTKKNTDRRLLMGTLALSLGMATLPGVLQAQPEGDGPPPPPPGQDGGRGGRGGWGGRGGDNRNMTPEQREQEMQQRRTQQLNRMLSEAGFIDKDVQDAVIAFANAQDAERRNSRNNAQKLSEALREGEDNVTLAAILSDMRADARESEAKRVAALNALDEKIHFKSNARLEAVLVLAGLTGEVAFGGGPRGGDGPGRGGNRGGNRGGGPGGGGPRGNRPDAPDQ